MRLSRLTLLVAAAAVGALFVAGLAVSGALGGILLLGVAGVLLVLSRATWRRVSPGGRAYSSPSRRTHDAHAMMGGYLDREALRSSA